MATSKIPKKKNEAPVSKPKHRRPNRKRFKKQITVRIDENLLGSALTRAEENGMNLTGAIEMGLWLYHLKMGGEPVPRGQFMLEVLPEDQLKLTMAFWGWMRNPHPTPADKVIRDMLTKLINIYRNSPEFEGELRALAQKNEDAFREATWPKP